MDLKTLHIKLLLFLNFIFLYQQANTTGIYNVLNKVTLPVIFDANAKHFNVITSGNIYVINKETREKREIGFTTYLPWIFFIWIKQKIIFS